MTVETSKIPPVAPIHIYEITKNLQNPKPVKPMLAGFLQLTVVLPGTETPTRGNSNENFQGANGIETDQVGLNPRDDMCEYEWMWVCHGLGVYKFMAVKKLAK